MDNKYPTCASCSLDWSQCLCLGAHGHAPNNCPTVGQQELKKRALKALAASDVFEFAQIASIQESEGYQFREKGPGFIRPIKPRIVEIMEFAQKMNFQRLGLVFCIGLRREAAVVNEIFTQNGFEVISIVCKAGRVPKKELDLGKQHYIDKTAEMEVMCNPILQAYVVNLYQTGLNVMLGLCVGHDSLFMKYAKGYTTVLAVKDRLLGHNPLAAIYQDKSYYNYLKKNIL